MRYQKIHSQIWHDEKFMQFTPEAQRLFLYLMSSPHSNSIGLYVIPKMYICADLQLTIQQLKKPFDELIKNGLIMYDDSVNLLLIINHLKHNKIENEKQAQGASKIVAILPKSKLYQEVIIQLPKHYHNPLVKALKELYAIPEEKEKEKTEEETKEKENIYVDFPDLNIKAWESWLAYKKLIKDKYKTERGEKAKIQNLINITNGDKNYQAELIDYAIKEEWKGIYIPNGGGNEKGRQAHRPNKPTGADNIAVILKDIYEGRGDEGGAG